LFNKLISRNIQNFGHLGLILGRSATLSSQLRKSLLLCLECTLDFGPRLIEFSSLVLTDLLSNFFFVEIITSSCIKLSVISVEVSGWRLEDNLGLLDNVVLNILFDVVVSFISSFVHYDFSTSLIEDSFSHVLIFLHSNGFTDILLN